MITTTFLTIGFVGLLLATVAFPVLGIAARLIHRINAQGSRQTGHLTSLAILIPAHNEGKQIGETLTSINAAVAYHQKHNPSLQVTIIVGADGCSDNTAAIAQEHNVRVVTSGKALGKWGMIKYLLDQAWAFEWVAFVDSGSLWPAALLTQVTNRIADDGRVMAVAPSYNNPAAGSVARIAWSVERFLKSLENLAGGPISVHGATVFYRTDQVMEAMRALDSHESWLNDDVAVPLMMRILFPRYATVYLPSVAVSDMPSETTRREYGRRRRMAVGNLEWIQRIGVQGPISVRCLQLRRIFRMMWAYWVICLATGMFLVIGNLLGMASFSLSATAAGTAILLALIPSVAQRTGGTALRKLASGLDVARASLATPLFAILRSSQLRIGWR